VSPKKPGKHRFGGLLKKKERRAKFSLTYGREVGIIKKLVAE